MPQSLAAGSGVSRRDFALSWTAGEVVADEVGVWSGTRGFPLIMRWLSRVTRAEQPCPQARWQSSSHVCSGSGRQGADLPAEGKGCRAGRDPSLIKMEPAKLACHLRPELVAGDCGHRPDLATGWDGSSGLGCPQPEVPPPSSQTESALSPCGGQCPLLTSATVWPPGGLCLSAEVCSPGTSA